MSLMSKVKSEKNMMSLFTKVENTEDSNDTQAGPSAQPMETLEIPPPPAVEQEADRVFKPECVGRWMTKDEDSRSFVGYENINIQVLD